MFCVTLLPHADPGNCRYAPDVKPLTGFDFTALTRTSVKQMIQKNK